MQLLNSCGVMFPSHNHECSTSPVVLLPSIKYLLLRLPTSVRVVRSLKINEQEANQVWTNGHLWGFPQRDKLTQRGCCLQPEISCPANEIQNEVKPADLFTFDEVILIQSKPP